ncbi:hypothetical protein N0V94_000535 [Neodidymelliopsis sp. IMI 364377]|nr:hypothetical protein N0V94_000535 [Neodidymelliopsis sp. IMI 364377]
MNDLTSLSCEIERLQRDNLSFADLAVEIRRLQDQVFKLTNENHKLTNENHTLHSMEMQRREHHGEMRRRLIEVEAERDAAENERDEYRAECERLEGKLGIDRIEEDEDLRKQVRSGQAEIVRLEQELEQVRQSQAEAVDVNTMQDAQQVCSFWAGTGKCRLAAPGGMCSSGYHPAQAVTETMIPAEKTSHSIEEV